MSTASSEGTHLTRTLTLPSLVLFGLAYLAPLIVLGIFGVIAETTGGAASSAYLVALVAMMFTAHSYGRMAIAHPVAGSAYTYVRRSIEPRTGFLVGWTMLLDYLFLPLVIWLIGGSYLTAQFPSVPIGIWIVMYMAITTALNILGIKVADKANFLLMAFQMLVIVIFVALCIASVVSDRGAGSLLSVQPFVNSSTSITAITSGAAIAAYSFLGFDAITTLTEETIEPKKNMPRAILLIALIGGAIFVVVSYATQLVHPGGSFPDPDSAASDVALQIGGSLFAAIFLAGLVIAQFASGIAAQASASRLLYAMGRDGTLPKKIFGRLNSKFHTPVINIVITGVIGLGGMLMDVATSTSFINFGAFIAFTAVNVSVIFYFFRQRRQGRRHSVIAYVLLPIIGAVISIFLITQLDVHALTVGIIWFCLGVVVLGFITRGFRQAPPDMSDI
ncbi:APC family permease [Kocuria sp. TGY1127_2]|uniref:APC family permease n=1 Tax=Kocuria sp. TGY1127_2 TaxID=2711328 RepID=UPI0015BA5226|nr:APC family permease [Kocuria sp. TGY1127_2]